MSNRPDELGKWATDPTASITEPDSSKQSVGYYDGEFVPSDYVNFHQNNSYLWNLYLKDLPNGLVTAGFANGLNCYLSSGVGGGTFSLYGDNWAVNGINIVSNYLSIAGDYRNSLCIGQRLVLNGNTGGNDGTYTIQSVVYFPANTLITLEEPLPGAATADGTLYAGGKLLSRCGTKIEIDAQIDYNVASPATIPVGARIDYIVAKYNQSTNTLTIPVVIEGPSVPATNDYVIARIEANVSGGLYDAEKITVSERIHEKNICFVGDGVNSFSNNAFDTAESIQDAIDLMSSRGGGIVYVTGDIPIKTTASINLKSKVAVIGANKGQIRTGSKATDGGVDYSIGAIGWNGAGATIAASPLNTLQDVGIDFNDAGVGSILDVTSGVQQARYRIGKILSSDTVELYNEDGSKASLVNEVGLAYDVYITDASFSNIGVIHDEGNANTQAFRAHYAEGLSLIGTEFKSLSIAYNQCMSFVETENVRLSCNCDANFTISFATSGSNERWTVDGSWFIGDASLSSTGSGLSQWGTNYVSGTLTLPANTKNHTGPLSVTGAINATGNISGAVVSGSTVNSSGTVNSGTSMNATTSVNAGTSVSATTDSVYGTALYGGQNNGLATATNGFCHLPSLVGYPTAGPTVFGLRMPEVTVPSKFSRHIYDLATATWYRRPILPLAVKAYMSANQSIASGSDVTIQFDREHFDSLSLFNTGTYTLTADHDIRIRISVHLPFATSASWTASDYLYLMVNSSGPDGNTIIDSKTVQGTGGGINVMSLTGSCITELAATDTMFLSVYQNSGVAMSIDSTMATLSIEEI